MWHVMELIVPFLSTQAQSRFERNNRERFSNDCPSNHNSSNGAIGIPANFLQLAMEKSCVQDAIGFGFASHLLKN